MEREMREPERESTMLAGEVANEPYDRWGASRPWSGTA